MVLLTKILSASLLLHLVSAGDGHHGVPKLNFEVQRRNRVAERSTDDDTRQYERDGPVELDIHNRDSYYMAKLKIGSNEDEVNVLIDTGSSDLWVMSPDVSCSAGSKKRGLFNDECTSYGSFDSDKSDTYHSNSSAPDFTITYSDNTKAQGSWGYDNVKIGDVKVKDLSFAVVDKSSSAEGVLGIGLPALEVTYQQSSSPYKYSNLPMKLKEQGDIKKVAYSLYLGNSSAASGTVLFGAVDHEKYSGQLTTVPIINSLSQYYNDPVKLEVLTSGISVTNGKSDVSVTENKYSAVLDSGTTLSYFPKPLFSAIGEILDGELSSSSLYEIECVSKGQVIVKINFSGKVINVDLSQLLITSSSDQCYLGILEQDSDYILLGDNFLRSVYAVYDLEDYEISLAQVKYSEKEDVQSIVSSVPSASKAKSYSATYFQSSYYEPKPTSHITYASQPITSSDYLDVSLSGLSTDSQASTSSKHVKASKSANPSSTTSKESNFKQSGSSKASSTASSTSKDSSASKHLDLTYCSIQLCLGLLVSTLCLI